MLKLRLLILHQPQILNDQLKAYAKEKMFIE